MLNTKDNYDIIDLLASEYSWTLEYILSLPIDVISALSKHIVERKLSEQAVTAKIIGIATACAFSGKLEKLDSMFSSSTETPTEPTEQEQKNSMLALWLKLGRDPKDFEKQFKEGTVKF